MAGFLKKTPKSAEFAKGGNTHMFGQQAAEPMPEGHTGDPSSQDGHGDKFAKGGSDKMFGYTGSQPARAGITGAR